MQRQTCVTCLYIYIYREEDWLEGWGGGWLGVGGGGAGGPGPDRFSIDLFWA